MMNALKSRRLGGFAVAVLTTIALAGCATGGGMANPFAGTWDFVVESELGTLEQVVKVADDMTGMVTMTEPSEATLEMSNIALDGNNLTFDIVFDLEGTELPAQFVGTIDGDNITGEYVTDLGNGTVTGTRAG